MSYKIVGNLQNRTFKNYPTYRYPVESHPNKLIIPAEAKDAINCFFGKVLDARDYHAVLEGRFLARSYWQEDRKIDTMKLLKITPSHLQLIDLIIGQMNVDWTNFVRVDQWDDDAPDDQKSIWLSAAKKASFEYHLIAPVMNQDGIQHLRAMGMLNADHG